MKAVVFDCDGVLVDSEPLARDAWGHALRLHGHAPTPEDLDAVRGRTYAAGYAYFSAKVPLPPIAELQTQTGAYWETNLDRLRIFPDVADTVTALAARGVPLAVASSSRRRELDRKLATFDLTRHFDATVAGDEVTGGKPEPDLFLVAAERLGVDPGDCLAIDDTEIGADAAVAAGMDAVRLTREGEVSVGHPTRPTLDADWIGRRIGLR